MVERGEGGIDRQTERQRRAEKQTEGHTQTYITSGTIRKYNHGVDNA